MSLEAIRVSSDGTQLLQLLRCFALLESLHISEHVLRGAAEHAEFSSCKEDQIATLFMDQGRWISLRFGRRVTDLDTLGLLAEVNHESGRIRFTLRHQFADWLRPQLDISDLLAATRLLSGYIERHWQSSGVGMSSMPLRRRQELNAHVDARLETTRATVEPIDVTHNNSRVSHATVRLMGC